MGFAPSEQSDLLFEKVFMAISETIDEIDFSDSKDELIRLSMKIYEELLFAKGICDGNV